MFLNFLILLALTCVSAAIAFGAGYLTLSGSTLTKFFKKYGAIIAAAAILYIVFGDIIPEVLESNLSNVMTLVMIAVGIISCLALGTVVGHVHDHDHSGHGKIKDKKQAVSMLVIDCFHTALDGVVIGIAFANSVEAGALTVLGITLHEIPQKIGDFSLMNRSKMNKKYILKMQGMAAAILIPAAALAFFLGDLFESALPTLLAFTAGFFLYIAFDEISDMIRDVWRRAKKSSPKTIN